MRALTKTWTSLAVLLLLQSHGLATAQSQDAGSPQFREEFSKQESIYHDRAEDYVKGYVTDRSLEDYCSALPAEFDRSLARLGPKDRWLDIGAGMGLAILDYYSPRYDLTHADGQEARGKKARAVAMSIEDRRTVFWEQAAARLEADQIQYLFKKRLQEYSLDELGRFQIITDVIGGFSYSSNLSFFMEKVLGFLDVNGSFYTVLQDVHSESGPNTPYYKGSPFLTEIKDAADSEVKVCSWLKTIGCVEVTCEAKPSWQPPIEVYRVRKVCDNVTVPPLEAIHFAAGTPPERTFRLASPPPPSPDLIGASR